MIGCEIQPERNRWSKRLGRFQLERTHFNGEHVVFDFLACDLGKRFTNVAAGNCLLSAIVQHLSKHFRRGRFAVGSGNCDDGRFARTPAELELADDLDLSGREILCQGRSRIDSGTRDDEIVFARILIGCWSANDANILRAQIVDRGFEQLVLIGAVQDGDVGAFGFEKKGGGRST